MILGDSHIVQDGVDDDETVGSALERYHERQASR